MSSSNTSLPFLSNMSSSSIPGHLPNSQNPDLKPLENQSPNPQTPEDQSSEISKQSDKQDEKGRNGGDERKNETGECRLCLFMKGGGCKHEFIAWLQCVEEAEKNKEDLDEKCSAVTLALTKCMNAHSDYYANLRMAEKVFMQHKS